MTPDEIARRFPRLFHVTEPRAAATVRELGLLTTLDALDLFEVDDFRKRTLTEKRRPDAVAIEHPDHGRLVLNDNKPLSEKALASCLDDGLSPSDWLRTLNGMVFFWPDANGLRPLLGAAVNRMREREVLVFDTYSLLTAHFDAARLSPINSGSTIHRPARRGIATFSNPADYSFADWRKLRGRTDRVREVAIVGSVRDASDHLLEVKAYGAFR